ncbi:YdeI/OmpD-associated family protein [Maritimibacter sp. DP1N21-5]|uniref:YdeI/OmpD-associated family protein n=1 Tax=Maritimibacter sp. DP1N21-5 TaxID=2836867 RepID=UPI001C44C52C|nr:YdeI/OmpD-associated family protein [Maritimibacter sp. DP1N21-5]MBV7408605.1 YdeI/OmpD-associated family protein [Maritimibacter sp. DP1N21-5]
MLKRERHELPEHIAARLELGGLRAAYDGRPDYQRNDYLGWICRAKRAETREKRVAQMLDELARGGVYMKMQWNGGRG